MLRGLLYACRIVLAWFARSSEFFQSFQETFILSCYHCFILPTWACHHLGLRQSHSALTLPSDDAYASAAPDANKAKLFQALSSVISNVLLLQACCQARLPSRTRSPPIRIWHSRLLLTMPALPSTTAMPNYTELCAREGSKMFTPLEI